MGGWVYVMEQRDFDNWLSGNVSGQTPVEQGRELFETKLGCASCHAGGPAQRGAKLEGIYGHDVKLVGGATVKADDEYIRNSILNPSSQVVEGFNRSCRRSRVRSPKSNLSRSSRISSRLAV
jgi:cytochrome c oxidase subunit 2